MKRLWMYFQEMRRHAKNGHLPVWRQFLEICLLWIFHRVGPGIYMEARLWRRDIPFSEKRLHMHEQAYAKAVEKRNDYRYRKLSENKLIDKAVLSLYGIPTPRFYGHLNPLRGVTFDGRPLTGPAELEALIRRHSLGKLCFKLTESYHGQGFCAAECLHKGEAVLLRPLFQEATYAVAEFCRDVLSFHERTDYLIEQYLEQDPWFKAYNPTSLNTLRVHAAWRDNDAAPRVLDGMFRMGNKGALIDSTRRGGLFAKIYAETGTLGPGYISTDKDHITYSHHPDNGLPLEGVKIPGWENTKELVCKALLLYPETRLIAFDIAMGLDGPYVIETNLRPGRPGPALLRIPAWQLAKPR